MLATMATVTSGILSPNSYVLSADAVALKLAAEPMDYHPHHHHHNHHHRQHHPNNHHHRPQQQQQQQQRHRHTSHQHNNSYQSNNPEQYSSDPQNSSDSEQETTYTTTTSSGSISTATTTTTTTAAISLSPKSHILEPKRNKRKNFKPRCSQNLPLEEDENGDGGGGGGGDDCEKEEGGGDSVLTLTLDEYNENNNVNNNIRRRKAIGGPRKLIQDPTSTTPIDLSGSKNDLDQISERLSSNNDESELTLLNQDDSELTKNDPMSDNSDSDDFNTENYRSPSEEDDGGGTTTKEDSEEGGNLEEINELNGINKIPSSFSIHNLSKPHHSTSSASSDHLFATQNLSSEQINEMRSYVMNTMRELLGIYGLTSEVAESISRQLPIAAFTTGKIFENLSISPSTTAISTVATSTIPSTTTAAAAAIGIKPHPPPLPPSSLSEPPTPPSTPISPKYLADSSSRSTPLLFNSSGSSLLLTPSSHFGPASSAIKLPHQGLNISHTSSSIGTPGIGGGGVGAAGGGGGGNGQNSKSTTTHQHQQNFPLNLNVKKEEQDFLVGEVSNNGLIADYSDLDGFRLKIDNCDRLSDDGRRMNIFPGNLSFSHLNKTDAQSPPPMDSPLNALLQQSMSSSLVQARESLSTSSSNLLQINKSSSQMDYTKYVKKYGSSLECGNGYCKDLNYREHFHCLDCNSRVFIKKEEMIRHFKWHKKRDESLQHGFMRYSPLDDCSDKYSNCTHNKKQTHYHCIQENCDKVYISTSDVQMHSNYHRKDSAIMQEGFQRYRATEECGASYCAFFGQRTTHFHCRRSGCRYTFKNKSDMEKHKTYHIKDEQLSRDGFKKFMKNEMCPFDNCRFSKVCNHIHCIRPQCSYVLHSSGQLFSHKRKHERKDSELAYRKYKLAQSMMKTLAEGGGPTTPGQSATFNSLARDYEAQIDLANFYNQQNSISNISNTESLSDRNSPLSYNDESEGALAIDLSAGESSNFPLQEDSFNVEDYWRKYCQVVVDGQQCLFKSNCDYSFQEHYHCLQDNCEVIQTSKEGAKEHSRNHEQQEIITDNFFSISEINDPCEDQTCVYQNKEKHYHCNIDNCREIILSSDKPFRRLEHYKMHQYSQKLSLTKDPLTATHLATSIDGMFCRKRGRPPKNRVIEVWNDYSPSGGSQSLMDSPQAIFTSFKLPKSSITPSGGSSNKEMEQDDDDQSPPFHFRSTSVSLAEFAISLQSFDSYAENTKCPDNLCSFLGSSHFHCNRKKCFYSTDQKDSLVAHSKDFHENVEILDGFEFYDRMFDCRLQGCPSNKINRHFHCTRPNCNYSFVQYSQMAIHNQKHEAILEKPQTSFPCIRVKSEEQLVERDRDHDNKSLDFTAVNLTQSGESNKISVVRASGTFYPLSTQPVAVEQRRSPPNHVIVSEHHHLHPHLPAILDPQNAPSTMLYGPEISCSRPFCKLKRKPHYHCNACNQAFSEIDKLLPHVARHSSGALQSGNFPSISSSITTSIEQENNNIDNNEKERNNSIHEESEHVIERDSEPGKLSVTNLSMLQGSQISLADKPSPVQATIKESSTPDTATTAYFSTPTFDAYNHFTQFTPNFATQIALMQQQNAFLPQTLYQQGIPSQIMFQHAQLMQAPLLGHQNHTFATENLTSPLAAMAANLNKRAISPQEMTTDAKKARIQNSMRILKDEPVPAGYLRFRFNEDCKYQHCGYREHQTHFHCQRQDCGYSFCDKTRFVQHTARHERLDTLMGGDFQQYRANVACGRQDCAYTANLGSTQNKASHFHCLKCEFVCTDTNKVVAHRRQHQKLDSIQAAGFEKFTPSQMCRVQNCQHGGKQTHYHCLSCQYAVLGLAQMSAHKYRHMDSS